MVTRLYEGDKNETGGTGIEVTDNKVINLILRSLNNLIKVNGDNEVYVDLQLEDGIENSDSLPIGVNVGRVLQADGRPATGTLISGQTTSGDRVKVLYGDDGVLRVDNGTGTRKVLQYQMSAGTGININNNTIFNTGVTSVNGQTGDVTVTFSHGIASMMWQNSRWELLYGTLSEDTICIFTTSSGNQALEGSIYTTDGTEIISIAGTIPNSLYTSSMATGILKEIQGEWYFFPRQGAGSQNPPV